MAAVNGMSSASKCLCSGVTEVLLLHLGKAVNFSAGSTTGRERQLDVDNNIYDGIYILGGGVCRIIVYFVGVSCLVRHLSNLCSEKFERGLLEQESEKPKYLLFLTGMF